MIGMICYIAVPAAAAQNKTGVVVLSHGAPIPAWNNKIAALVSSVTSAYPVECAFLDFDKTRTLEKAVKQLEDKGVASALVVHLSPS
ncbi:MAG: hypothetical protein GY868_18975, partial [Deltaproteobacteria bacterium]|nr:hypothetical protein [Deltaproteobacteria bacterium]